MDFEKNITNREKILGGIIVLLLGYIGFTAGTLIDYYKYHADYVSINGKKFYEPDLLKEAPELMVKLKNDYQRNLGAVFNQFAGKKILEMEAEEKGVKADDLVSSAVGTPSEAEISQVYEQYKSQLQGRSLEEVRDDIVSFVKSRKESEFFEGLKAKYEIDMNMSELPVVKKDVQPGNNPSLGSKNAKVTIVEFSDFECPFCKKSQEVNRQLRAKYGETIRWVFRDFPLPFHKKAMFAHIAVNCAIPQGKYWDYFNLLFDNSENLSRENVISLSKKAGLEQAAFQNCLKDKNVENEIQQDIAYARSIGVNSTPSFFINGYPLEGAMPIEKFSEIIDNELKK